MSGIPHNAQQLAVAAMRRGDLGTAAGLCQKILSRNRRDVQAMALLAQLHHICGRDDEAADILRKCVKIDPRNVPVRVDLGEVYAAQARYRDALVHLDAALRAAPDHADAVMLKAMVHEREGRYDRAEKVLAPAVRGAATPPGIAAVAMRIMIRDGRHEEALELGRSVTGTAREPSYQLRDVHFAIARANERLGRYDETMDAAEIANGMLAAPFDPAAHEAMIDALIEACSAERLAAIPRSAESSDVPVFIVGLPRTGSTLTERIIHAHPEAFGAGEIGALPALVQGLQLRIGSVHGYPRCLADLDAGDAESIGRDYVAQLTREGSRAGRMRRVVDKYLANYLHLGLVDVLFPRARVIDCRRDPVDNCLSCYLERLAPQSAPYAADLGWLGFVYRQYERLMDHWRQVLTIPVLEVRYEALIADQAAETRRILEFCGLEWNDACLQFHEAKRHDNTLSFDQVRRPLYRESVGRAERFGALLDPLRGALAGEENR